MPACFRSLSLFSLDRDSARWNLDPGTVQKRRALFWEIFAADVSHVSFLDIHVPSKDHIDNQLRYEEFGTWSPSRYPSLIC